MMGMTTAVREGEEFEDVKVPAAEPRSPDEEAKGAAAVEAFARDHEGLTEEDERDALDFLLAPKPSRLYDVKVTYDTEAGPRPLTFVIKGMNGRKLDDIEQGCVSEATGRMDRITADCRIVGEATEFLQTAKRKVELSSEEYLTIVRPDPERPGSVIRNRLASPADALEARFATQLGIISGVAREVRRISGYDPERVGSAQRRLVEAAGNS